MELARNLRVESVSRLGLSPPRAVTPAQSVAEAVALMRRDNSGCLLVCAEDRLVGIFTERDLLRRVLATGRPLSTRLADCMTPDPVVVSPSAPISTALRLMEEGGYRHLPVIDETGRPVGVLSVKRIVHYLAEHFPAIVYNQPPDPSTVPHSPEGA
jgi:CBS domain-containing protein